ncbi:MAG: FKBP-type peptidyl-prolyl cis-trans isomerase [Proteobacteria bacterium]|nr:FKBP-type peptidyl-prolyl cis-trans isomerase [Pseudomonadota bacterium]
MQRVKQGDQVIIEYKGTLTDNEETDSSVDSGSLEFEVGAGKVFPGFDKGVLDMAVNETISITLAPEDAYGQQDKELLHTVNKEVLGPDVDPKPGMILGMDIERSGQKHKIPALVTVVKDDQVEIDFNHPLAGKTLTYQLTLKEIK